MFTAHGALRRGMSRKVIHDIIYGQVSVNNNRESSYGYDLNEIPQP